MLDFNFILDENYLAYFILSKTMYNEKEEIKSIKSSLNNNIGYKKITGRLIPGMDDKTQKEYECLINDLISCEEFITIYKSYSSLSKEELAKNILLGNIDNKTVDLEKIKDELWEKYKDAYNTLLHFNWYNPSIILNDKDVLDTINSFILTDEFKRLFFEAKEYNNYLIKKWNENKEYINKYLSNVLKIDFNITPNVYVSHPYANVGYTFDNNIAWGHYKGINNSSYNLTYLVHESMHILFPFRENESEEEMNIKHAIIELISDYELQSKLTNESTFNNGHSYLDEYKRNIYTYWLNYLGLNNDEIIKRSKQDNIQLIELNENLSNININEFIKYCKYKCINKGVFR